MRPAFASGPPVDRRAGETRRFGDCRQCAALLIENSAAGAAGKSSDAVYVNSANQSANRERRIPTTARCAVTGLPE